MKENRNIASLIGTPQGSVVSPILGNIYLHELDVMMEKVTEESKLSGTTSRNSKEYLKLHSSIHTQYRKLEKNGKLTDENRLRLKEMIRQRSRLPSKIGGPGYRVYYVRYADDFLIGINGPKRIAEELKEEINVFLADTLKLTMSLEKTKITPATPRVGINNKIQDSVLFLGTEIKRIQSKTHDQPTATYMKKTEGAESTTRVKRRISATTLSLRIPVERVVKRLAEQQFCEIKDFQQGQIKPMGKPS